MSKCDFANRKQRLREALSVRYGPELYHSFGRTDVYHFVYAYKRFLWEIFKTVIALLTPKPHLRPSAGLGLYATANQRNALANALHAGHLEGRLLSVNNLSRRALALRLLVWITKPVIYPFAFAGSRHRAALYQTCLIDGMIAYTQLFLKKLEELKTERLYISNDHSGDIYLLSILVRGRNALTVTYVQHGAVKPEFPENYFHTIYVYDERYAEIYRKLSRNPAVRIIVDPAISGHCTDGLPEIDLLICFSHQFPLLPTIALMHAINNFSDIRVAVRFHPSDRFAKFKLFLLKVVHQVECADSNVAYSIDFSRAQLILCASSSLLPDAINKGFAPRLIWARQLGLEWDYYGVRGRIPEVSRASEILVYLDQVRVR